MSINCDKCHARYYMGHEMFHGAKEVQVRCRRCGNFIYVANPEGIAPEGNVGNDKASPWDPSDNRAIEPAISLAGEEQSTFPEMEWTLPEGEPASLSQENGAEEDAWEEIWRRPLPVSADAHAPQMFYPPFPNPPPKARSRLASRWFPLIVLCILLLLVAGGSTYFLFTPVGKAMLAGIGHDLADAVTYFRS